ncbi:protein Wiz [Nerophis lumbriciformis]|uniref:protein Wiz n=1 Tax=Nerophis lumbriciformis TaxID=546530 RepID=UPI002ADF1A44|nr:protein Wiz [Nerophis lumbriciformis]XP_061844157.1 protein Wiz [Nerophis lumbriciformis]
MATPKEMAQQRSPVRPSAALVLATSPSAVRRPEGSHLSSSAHQTITPKPMWAPLETDAPITLASQNNDEVHVCKLCSCWYETKKGLSSHARFHLRQIGIPESEIKGSPIDFLYQIMNEDKLKSVSKDRQEPRPPNSLLGTPIKRPSEVSTSPTSPPCKRPKPSEMCTCTLCGEKCKNRRGLASHARSHLRQMGVLDLLGKAESAIDTVQDLVNSGVLETMRPPKVKSTSSSNAIPSSAPTSPLPSPPRSPVTGQARPSFFQSPAKSPQIPGNRAPKAKKGFRLAVDPLLKKPKPEPFEVDVSALIGSSCSSSITPTLTSSPPVASSLSLSAASATDEQSPPTVLCDYCGQLFETRKALSCHARAHLRQLGLTWSIKTSPIDILYDVMMQGENNDKGFFPGEAVLLKKASFSPQRSKRTSETTSNSCSSPLDYSMKEKTPSGKSEALIIDKSCEVCGFVFENRTALASHARAHLRQLGISEWKAEGATSPIEHLSEVMQKHPAKVAALRKRYREGDLSIKKKGSSFSYMSSDSESLPAPNMKISGHSLGKEDQGVSPGSSKKPLGHTHPEAPRGSTGVRSPRERTVPKQPPPAEEENQGTNSQQLSKSGNIPALLPKPPLTPLVKLVGKVYSLKCRFCEKVFHGPLSVQEQWITHLQEHILSLGYKGKESPPAAPVASAALMHPVAV